MVLSVKVLHYIDGVSPARDKYRPKEGNNDSTRSVGGRFVAASLDSVERENWRRFLHQSGALLGPRLISYNYEVYLLTSFRSAKNILQYVVFPIFLPLLCF